jgi:hypothetical protein
MPTEVEKPRRKKKRLTTGPGTELKRMLKFFRVKESGGCGCSSKARQMNERGTEWCRKNVRRIEGWLKAEAERRGLPFSGFAARRLIKLAIWRAERKQNKRKKSEQSA